MDLVALTAAAERTITSDLEYLISKAVDTNKADYAVITGARPGCLLLGSCPPACCWLARCSPLPAPACSHPILPAPPPHCTTGVQIHNWAYDLDDKSIPSIEFVAPAKSFVVVNGEKHYLDLLKVPALSPRQLKVLAAASGDGTTDDTAGAATSSMLQAIPRDYLMKRLGGASST
jgi:hypothetical protein